VKILDRYLLREFVLYSLLGISTFVALFILVDLFEKLDIFVDHRTPLLTVARLYAYGLPSILTQVLPVAVLLGALLGLSTLRKNNEITAMQGAGQSPWRLARPLLLAALALSIAQYGMNELIGPQAHARQQRILAEEIKGQSDPGRENRSEVRLLGGGRRFWIARFYEGRTRTLREVSVQFLNQPALRRRIDATAARWRDGSWRFEDGYYRVFHDSTDTVLRFRAYGTNEIEELPDDFRATVRDPFYMSMRNLLVFARRLRESGGEVQKHMTNFHLRVSFPLADLVMVLLGAALSLRVVRGGNLAVGFGISVAVGFTYFALIRVGQAFGYNGNLPPLLAAWLGNLVFATLGGFLFWKVAR
jgi:lipopolysaccharide export system permease protein